MSDVEWVEESNWEKVNIGDRIKLTKADFLISGKVSTSVKNPGGVFFSGHGGICFYEYEGFTLFVERPVVQLPTEPGYYLDNEGEVWDLSASDELVCISMECYGPELYAPLRRLRPVAEIRAETAKEVIDFLKSTSSPVDQYSDFPRYGVSEPAFLAAAREFGVTDE